jgi:hypothetical protein
VLQQSARRRDQQVHLIHRVLLFLDVLAADQQTRAERVVRPGVHQLLEDLHRQLARRRDDQSAEPVLPSPLLPEQNLEQRNDKGQGFPRARLRRAEYVPAAQRVRDGGSLNRGQLLEPRRG